MTTARRIVGVGAFLGLVAWVSTLQSQTSAPFAPNRPATPYVVTPAQEKATDKLEAESRFAKGGVFTYRARKDEQVFAIALKPELPASSVKGRDYLVMISVSATQAGEGWQASMQFADGLLKSLGADDRVSLWKIGVPQVTTSLVKGGEFLSPKDKDGKEKLEKALEQLKVSYPAGDTDLKGGIENALASFENRESRQQILVFLGDGQSTHNPIDAAARFKLCQDLAAKRVAFFPVPLGLHLHAENLHGLANGTGGVVLRTEVGKEPVAAALARFAKAFTAPILYQAQLTLPASVKSHVPSQLPPLRSDASTLVVGTMQPLDEGDFAMTVSGSPLGGAVPITWKGIEKIQPPDTDNFFLLSLNSQWQGAKERFATLRGDRTLALAMEQIRLFRDDLLLTGQLAIKEHNYAAAKTAFNNVVRLAPHDLEAPAGLGIVDRLEKGTLTPKQIEDMVGAPRQVRKFEQKDGKAVIILAQAPAAVDKKELNPVVPAPGKQERDDLLQAHRDQKVILEQKWTEIVENTLRQGRRDLNQDPDGVLDSLRNLLSRVKENPSISDRVRDGLAARLETSLRESTGQARLLLIQRAQSRENLATQTVLMNRGEQNRTQQERLSAQIGVFRTQIERAFLEERIKQEVLSGLLAMQSEQRLRGQRMPLAGQATYEQVLAGYNLEKAKEFRTRSQDRYLAVMVAIQKSHIPFPDEPGLEYPKLATWKKITDYRKEKYEVGDLPDNPKGKAASKSLNETLEETIDIPDEFKQPVQLRLILKYITDKVALKGKDFPFWITADAAKEKDKDLSEELVQYPPFFKKMQIAVALRIALSQLSALDNVNGPLTYIVRPSHIEVVNVDTAVREKVIRVHPVADLTIPISQAGGQQQFGQSASITPAVVGGAFGNGGNIGGGGGGGVGLLGGSGITPGSSLGGTAGSFNGGSFSGGFNGSLGALGGAGMQDLIDVIRIIVDPGHWFYVKQSNPFQSSTLGNVLGAGGLAGVGQGGGAGLGGLGGGGLAAQPLGIAEGGAAPLDSPYTNTIHPYMPTLALIIRAQARTHTSYTGGPAGIGKAAVGGQVKAVLNPNQVQIAGAANDKNQKNPIAQLAGKDPAMMAAVNEKGQPLKIDPRVWDTALAQGNIPVSVVIATAELLFEQPDKKHVAEFLKANLRQGLVVRPWVYEALAIALETSGGDADEIRRARLSAVALDPKDADGFVEAARTLAENGQHDRALAFCRQAALLEPNLVHSYKNALVYAEAGKDARSMEWAVDQLLSRDWPVDNNVIRLTAQTRANALAATLEAEKRKPEADKVRAALQLVNRRDLVINLTYEASQEPAEVELFVKEPTGSTCSIDQRQTPAGGTLVTDSKFANKVSYVAALGFDGAYEIGVRRLWGRPLFGQARLEIIQHLGTPQEVRRMEIVKLDQKKTFQVSLVGGRRVEYAVVSPSNLRKRDETNVAAKKQSGADQLRQLMQPEIAGGTATPGARAQTMAGKLGIDEATPRSPMPAFAATDFEPRVADNRSLTTAVYQNLQAGKNANLSLIPGGR